MRRTERREREVRSVVVEEITVVECDRCGALAPEVLGFDARDGSASLVPKLTGWVEAFTHPPVRESVHALPVRVFEVCPACVPAIREAARNQREQAKAEAVG